MNQHLIADAGVEQRDTERLPFVDEATCATRPASRIESIVARS
jgi:hypothetical protein